MIPIVEAISLSELQLPGGTTRPMLMAVQNGEGDILTSVVKTFSAKDHEQYSPIGYECMGSFLARAFDLPVPPFHLVSFSPTFVNEQLPLPVKERVSPMAGKLFFGSEFQPGFIQYVPLKHRRSFLLHDMETIFAFDVLIHNRDRRKGKPNLIVKQKDYFLLDHESALHIAHPFTFYLTQNPWPFITGRVAGNTHIFLEPLRRLHKQGEVTFDTFFEYLRLLDLREVKAFHNHLTRNGVTYASFSSFLSYLKEIKQEADKFRQLLFYFLQ